MLDREAILVAKDLPKEVVEVPEWGGQVYVRAMDGVSRDLFEAELQNRTQTSGKIDIRGLKVLLVGLSVCDEDGKLLFGSEDVDALNSKSASALNRLFEVAQRLSALSGTEVNELLGN